MAQFDKIFELTKKLSRALRDNKGFRELEESDIFSEKAKVHIKQQLSEKDIKEHLELLKGIDREAAWGNIENRIADHGISKPKKRNAMPSLYKVAAAVVLLGALTYILYDGRTPDTLWVAEPLQIFAGTEKAILTLEDGSEVVLQKGKSFQNNTVHTNGERLEYASSNSNSITDFNVLTIPRGGQYQVVLSDGTVVWLNADTKIKYPVNFVEGEPRNLELVYGEAYFKVSPSSKHKGSLFKVATSGHEVEVTGTEFAIKAYRDERQVYTTLVEGHVNVVVDNNRQQLLPSQQTVWDIHTKQISKQTVNVAYDISWVKGYFNFKDKPLKDIMTVLSRWYDVEITFEHQDLERIKFSGLLSRKQDIQDILDGFSNTKFINAYDIKNRTITIK